MLSLRDSSLGAALREEHRKATEDRPRKIDLTCRLDEA
jgi:hypothetical protein